MSLSKHKVNTEIRAKAFSGLFGCQPSNVFTQDMLLKKPDKQFHIDVFVYKIQFGDTIFEVGVTNGMSDQPMDNADEQVEWKRREILQYFPICTEEHARRLHLMAWLPLFDKFYLDTHHSIAWHEPVIAGTPWNNAFFLEPLLNSHRQFEFSIDGERASFLWHIPISNEERAFKLEHGSDALIDRMEAVDLPWIFDENHRPSLLVR